MAEKDIPKLAKDGDDEEDAKTEGIFEEELQDKATLVTKGTGSKSRKEVKRAKNRRTKGED